MVPYSKHHLHKLNLLSFPVILDAILTNKLLSNAKCVFVWVTVHMCDYRVIYAVKWLSLIHI